MLMINGRPQPELAMVAFASPVGGKKAKERAVKPPPERAVPPKPERAVKPAAEQRKRTYKRRKKAAP